MDRYSAKKELHDETIKSAKDSVEFLNKEIKARFTGRDNLSIIAWASDIHLHKKDAAYEQPLNELYMNHIDTRRQFTLALHEVSALEMTPELLVFGGDMTDYGLGEEFLEFKKIMDKGIVAMPTLPLFGNHDNSGYGNPIKQEIIDVWPEVRQPSWPGIDDPDEFFYSVTLGNTHYIILDTLESTQYRMSDKQRNWLKDELNNTTMRTLVLCHRHQLPVGNWVDFASLFRDKEVWQWIDGCPHVMGVFSGHVHMPRHWQYRRKLYTTFPSVAYGIGGGTGWGGIVLDDDGIAGVFYKELYGESGDLFAGMTNQAGKFKFMEPEIYQNNILFNPTYFPFEQDPAKRD